MKPLKVYVIFGPDGQSYKPRRRGNRVFMVKSAAIGRCPKTEGFCVVEFELSSNDTGTVVHTSPCLMADT